MKQTTANTAGATEYTQYLAKARNNLECQVGSVLEASQHPTTGSLYTLFEIRPELVDSEGMCILTGAVPALSLSHAHTVPRRPIELSLLSENAMRPGSHILAASADKNVLFDYMRGVCNGTYTDRSGSYTDTRHRPLTLAMSTGDAEMSAAGAPAAAEPAAPPRTLTDVLASMSPEDQSVVAAVMKKVEDKVPQATAEKLADLEKMAKESNATHELTIDHLRELVAKLGENNPGLSVAQYEDIYKSQNPHRMDNMVRQLAVTACSIMGGTVTSSKQSQPGSKRARTESYQPQPPKPPQRAAPVLPPGFEMVTDVDMSSTSRVPLSDVEQAELFARAQTLTYE